jgi:hypothetical protein
MKNFLLAFVCLVVCLAGCKRNNMAGSILIFDIEAAVDNKRSFDLGEIAKEFEFITLDSSNSASLLGNYLEVQESKKNIYVYDGPKKPIKVFDKTGKFISVIGSIGRGPGELLSISDFTIDYLQDNVYMRNGSTIVACDAVGNLLARNDSILLSEAIVCIEDRLVVLKSSSKNESEPDGKMTLLEIFSKTLQRENGVNVLDKGSVIVETTSSEGLVYRYLPSAVISYDGSSVAVKETLVDTVFHYSANGVFEPAYRFNFGSRSIRPGSTGPNPTTFWNDRFYALNALWEGERYIVTRVNNFNDEHCLVFDRRNPTEGFSAIGFENDGGLFIEGILFMPCYIRDNRLVGYVQAIDIVDNAASITDPDLKALAATLEEDDNPVIVVAKLKK